MGEEARFIGRLWSAPPLRRFPSWAVSGGGLARRGSLRIGARPKQKRRSSAALQNLAEIRHGTWVVVALARHLIPAVARSGHIPGVVRAVKRRFLRPNVRPGKVAREPLEQRHRES